MTLSEETSQLLTSSVQGEGVEGSGLSSSLSEKGSEVTAPSFSTRGRIRKKLEELENQLGEKAREVESLKDRLLRLAADYDNYRKRTQGEMRELVISASERVIKALLPVMDDFERVLQQDPQRLTLESLTQGLELIYRKLQNILHNEGLAPINALGTPFNPLYHEAVAEMVVPDQPAGVVIAEVERGYTLGGKVIRHARVVVSKVPEPPSSDGSEQGVMSD